MKSKTSGSYGEKLPYKLNKNVSPPETVAAENLKNSLRGQPAVGKNQNAYQAADNE